MTDVSNVHGLRVGMIFVRNFGRVIGGFTDFTTLWRLH